jgi:hypothetical protein
MSSKCPKPKTRKKSCSRLRRTKRRISLPTVWLKSFPYHKFQCSPTFGVQRVRYWYPGRQGARA